MTRVLVIDDEPAIADVLRMLLEFRGHEVLTADDGSRVRDGAAAVARRDRARPDDAGDGRLRGARGSAERRADRRDPVVILSALGSTDVRQRCHDLGARAFLRSPATPKTSYGRSRAPPDPSRR
jgi:CheY-like chemotaxis protein